MPISGGKYVSPTWVNNSSPYINADELNAMSTTLALVPVANGGTGATTAANALTNLGALAKSNVTSKGNTSTPVYFDANGVANAITQPISRSLGGTGVANIGEFNLAYQLVNYLSGNASTDVGSATRPVYVHFNGENMHYVTQCTYELNKTVPSNAVFTDTTNLSAMTGVLTVNKGGTGMSGTIATTPSVSNLTNVKCNSWGNVFTLSFRVSAGSGSASLALASGFVKPKNDVYFLGGNIEATNNTGRCYLAIFTLTTAGALSWVPIFQTTNTGATATPTPPFYATVTYVTQ